MDCTSIECMTQVLELPNWPKKMRCLRASVEQNFGKPERLFEFIFLQRYSFDLRRLRFLD